MEISLPPEVAQAILRKHLPLERSTKVASVIHQVLAKIPNAPTKQLVIGDVGHILENGISAEHVLPALQAYFKGLSSDIFVD